MQPTTTSLILRTLLTLLWFAFANPIAAQEIVKLATTTSTENSGLLKFLLPAFEADTKIKVKVIAVGSGKALELAKNGDVDVVLVHAREAEDQFVAAGYGVDRRDVMYNDFIIVGPDNDPAHIQKEKNVLVALKKIIDSQQKFISRGDHSGTDIAEQSYWKLLGEKPKNGAYISAGLGMGEVLNMAAELQAYTLTDRATYEAYRLKTGLKILHEGDERLRNPYGILAVNPARYRDINYHGAKALIDWITSEQGRKRISAFKIGEGQLFFVY